MCSLISRDLFIVACLKFFSDLSRLAKDAPVNRAGFEFREGTVAHRRRRWSTKIPSFSKSRGKTEAPHVNGSSKTTGERIPTVKKKKKRMPIERNSPRSISPNNITHTQPNACSPYFDFPARACARPPLSHAACIALPPPRVQPPQFGAILPCWRTADRAHELVLKVILKVRGATSYGTLPGIGPTSCQCCLVCTWFFSFLFFFFYLPYFSYQWEDTVWPRDRREKKVICARSEFV